MAKYNLKFQLSDRSEIDAGTIEVKDGERGTSVLKITTAPTAYTTVTGGFTPAYRVALSTVLSQAKVDKVLVGDTVLRNYYIYQVGYVDSSYVYLSSYASIRGATGAAGTDGKTAYAYAQDGGYTGTEAEFSELLAYDAKTEDEQLSARITNETTTRQNAIRDLQQSVVNLGGEVVPIYVGVEAETVADMVLNSRNAHSFVMAMASDLHTTGNDTSATGIKHMGIAMDKINAITQLDLVTILGDVMVGYFDESYKEGFKHTKKCFHDISKAVPYIQLQGNHDQLKTDTTAEAQQKYFSRIGANNVGTVTDFNNRFRNYGYRDFDDQRLRVIYLNSADVSELEITTDCNITASQFSWFINTALNFSGKSNPETWHFVVMCHHPLYWEGIACMTNLLTLLDAYKGGTSGSITANGTTISYNFTASTRPKFIAHFHGHLHNFRVETMGNNGVVSITIPNGCFDRNNEYGTSSSYNATQHEKYGDVDASGNQRQFNKTSYTAEDTAFNVVVIDTENEKIRAFCYGAGVHRTITFDGVVTEFAKGEVGEPETPVVPDTPSFTNLVPTSIGTDNKVFNGTGYKENYRLSSSGGESAMSGAIVSGFIPVKSGDVIRVYGTTNTTHQGSGNYVIGYNSDFSAIANNYLAPTDAAGNDGIWEIKDGKALWTCDVGLFPTMPAYIRCSMNTCTSADFVVTINEAIV